MLINSFSWSQITQESLAGSQINYCVREDDDPSAVPPIYLLQEDF